MCSVWRCFSLPYSYSQLLVEECSHENYDRSYGGGDGGGRRIVIESGDWIIVIIVVVVVVVVVPPAPMADIGKSGRLVFGHRRGAPPPALCSLTSETRPPSHRRPTSRPRTTPSSNALSLSSSSSSSTKATWHEKITTVERPQRSLAHGVFDLVFGLLFILLVGIIQADSPIIG